MKRKKDGGSFHDQTFRYAQGGWTGKNTTKKKKTTFTKRRRIKRASQPKRYFNKTTENWGKQNKKRFTLKRKVAFIGIYTW
jgi:hypothetical protein